MRVYEVTVEVEAGRAETFARYMLAKHIPEILATGCFACIRFERSGAGRFRTRYEAAEPKDLEHYMEAHTGRFRADFMAHFPEGCTASREVWDEVHVFTGAGS